MKIGRMKTGDNWGKTKAFFDLNLDGLTIKGFRLVEGVNGLFVSMPSTKDKEGKYNDTVWADQDTRKKINEIALDAYKQGGVGSKASGGMSEIDRIHTTNSYADKDEIPF